jgi:transposase-like protein
MEKRYSDAFIEQALVKVYTRGKRTVQDVADELNVNFYTVKNWIRRKPLDKVIASANREKRPEEWQRDEQLVALHETHGMDDEAMLAWCREHGVFPHHLASWRDAFCVVTKPAVADASAMRELQKENDRLTRELDRKEKALAEAAALLMLQKKFRALWEDEVK